MKTFYIIDENGEFYSEDRKVRYKALSGNALHVFLASDQSMRWVRRYQRAYSVQKVLKM